MRLFAIYEEGQVSFLDVLLSAESVWDYISMPTRIQELTEADNAQMDEVEAQRQEVEKAQKELEEQNTELTNMLILFLVLFICLVQARIITNTP